MRVGYRSSSYFRDNLPVMADDSHPLRFKRNFRLADLATQEWPLPGPTIPVRPRLDMAFANQGLSVKSTSDADHYGTCCAGLLCIEFPEPNCSTHPVGMRELNLDANELDLHRQVSVIYPNGSNVKTPKIATFTQPRLTLFGAVLHDMYVDLPVFPEHVVYSGLQMAERLRADRIEAQYDGRSRTFACDMKDRIEGREPVFVQKFIDLLIRSARLDIAYP